MEISRNKFNPIQSNQNTLSQSELSRQLDNRQVTPETPKNSAVASIADPKAEAKKLNDAVNQLSIDADKQLKQHLVAMEKTQKAMLTSVNEFNAFKEEQAAANPGLDLSDLDLYQQEDGMLRLSSENLTSRQLSLLEDKLAENEVLKQAMSELHTGAALAANRNRDPSRQAAEFSAQDFSGTLRLNELAEKFSSLFDAEGFGKDRVSLEERISIDSLLFTDYLAESVTPRVDTRV